MMCMFVSFEFVCRRVINSIADVSFDNWFQN